ncbi:hypothetical protein ACE3MZ_07515 [Paenibacillus sp. WLX1005]|uniref:pilus assembly PilX family protein n=1 Tax=Paenibacillus sp. WLX1005 TaxID=3243766 RepID=UPI0039841800
MMGRKTTKQHPSASADQHIRIGSRIRNNWRSERGSALVMVMFVLLIMTVLGLAVMRATLTDAFMTEVRESDVQSLHLAQKSLDEAVALIGSQLNLSGDIDPVALAQKVATVNTSLQNLVVANASVPVAKNGQNFSRLISAAMKQETTTRFVFTLTSEATVNKISRKLQQKVTIDSYPEFLSYAFGSENNLILNGAPDIVGNIYAGGLLTTDNIANYEYKGKQLTASTTYPLLNGNAYVQSFGSIVKSGEPISQQPQNTESALQTALNIPVENVMIKNKQKFVQVNLDDTFVDKLAQATGIARDTLKTKYAQTATDSTGTKNAATLITSILSDSAYSSSTTFDRLDLKPVTLPANPTDEQIAAAQKAEADKQTKVQTNLPQLTKSTIFDGDLTLDGQTLNALVYPEKSSTVTGTDGVSTFNKWFIVNGNLNIINTGNTPIKIQANIISTGTVTIKGKVTMDSSMYVMKSAVSGSYSTVLEDAVITGLNDKEVVIMSKGSILLNRFDSFNNAQPAQLTGFFYTDAQATLYGVGSKFALNGGFFAKGDLTVNAVNGAANAGESTIAFSAPFNRSDSRFKVTYSDKVYAHQGLGLPRVNQITVNVGKLQLLPQSAS